MPEFDDDFPEEEFDASTDFKNEEDVTSPEYVAEGQYHFVVETVDATGKYSPGAVFLIFAVVTGNMPNQTGKTVKLPIWPPHPGAKDPVIAKRRWKKTVLRLMYALGLRKKGEFPKFKINAAWWESLEGKQCIGCVSHRERKQTTEGGKDVKWIDAVFANPGEDLHPFGDSAVATVPVDKNVMETGGYSDSKSGDI